GCDDQHQGRRHDDEGQHDGDRERDQQRRAPASDRPAPQPHRLEGVYSRHAQHFLRRFTFCGYWVRSRGLVGRPVARRMRTRGCFPRIVTRLCRRLSAFYRPNAAPRREGDVNRETVMVSYCCYLINAEDHIVKSWAIERSSEDEA